MDPIRIWRFEDAPEKYKRLSEHGGDEDWLAVVPKEFQEMWDDELRDRFFNTDQFGSCDVSEQTAESGERVFIGAHA